MSHSIPKQKTHKKFTISPPNDQAYFLVTGPCSKNSNIKFCSDDKEMWVMFNFLDSIKKYWPIKPACQTMFGCKCTALKLVNTGLTIGHICPVSASRSWYRFVKYLLQIFFTSQTLFR